MRLNMRKFSTSLLKIVSSIFLLIPLVSFAENAYVRQTVGKAYVVLNVENDSTTLVNVHRITGNSYAVTTVTTQGRKTNIVTVNPTVGKGGVKITKSELRK
jgi:hypothetical protein